MELDPIEYENIVKDFFNKSNRRIRDFSVIHNKILPAHDGDYQIDIVISFELDGLLYKSIVECKHFKNKIKRDYVQILYNKVQSLGAHKGIFVTSSDYQSGAIKFANAHGIALLLLRPGQDVEFVTKSPEKTRNPLPDYILQEIPKYGFIWLTNNIEIPLNAKGSLIFERELKKNVV